MQIINAIDPNASVMLVGGKFVVWSSLRTVVGETTCGAIVTTADDANSAIFSAMHDLVKAENVYRDLDEDHRAYHKWNGTCFAFVRLNNRLYSAKLDRVQKAIDSEEASYETFYRNGDVFD